MFHWPKRHKFIHFDANLIPFRLRYCEKVIAESNLIRQHPWAFHVSPGKRIESLTIRSFFCVLKINVVNLATKRAVGSLMFLHHNLLECPLSLLWRVLNSQSAKHEYLCWEPKQIRNFLFFCYPSFGILFVFRKFLNLSSFLLYWG